jgi:hypothetical protein
MYGEDIYHQIKMESTNGYNVKTMLNSNHQIVEMEAKSTPLTHAYITPNLVQHISKTWLA